MKFYSENIPLFKNVHLNVMVELMMRKLILQMFNLLEKDLLIFNFHLNISCRKDLAHFIYIYQFIIIKICLVNKIFFIHFVYFIAFLSQYVMRCRLRILSSVHMTNFYRIYPYKFAAVYCRN